MAKQIEFLDVDKEDYYNLGWKKKDIDDFLTIYQIISIETLKTTIRFWYNKED